MASRRIIISPSKKWSPWMHFLLVLSLLVIDTSAFAHAAATLDNHHSQPKCLSHAKRIPTIKTRRRNSIHTVQSTSFWNIPGGAQESSTHLSTATTSNNESTSSSSRLQQFGRTYMHWLQTKPLLTKSTTAVFVQLIGDILSQNLTGYWGRPAPWTFDYRRTLCFALLGFFYKAPLLHVMYRSYHRFGEYLEKTRHVPRNTRLMMELLLDQTVGVVVFYTSYFYVYEFFAAVTSGRVPNFASISAKSILNVMIGNYTVWPFSQYLSFRFVPEPLRVLQSNVVAAIFNIYLCAKIAAQ